MIRACSHTGTKIPFLTLLGFVAASLAVQTTVEHVLQAYGPIVNLTVEHEDNARKRLEQFFQNCAGSDQELAVRGVRFLRGDRSAPSRTAKT